MQAGAISDIAAVVANCDHALAAAEQQAGVSARTAVIGIAGELVKGTTSTVRFTRKNANRELSIDEMGKIIELVQERAETIRVRLAGQPGCKKGEIASTIRREIAAATGGVLALEFEWFDEDIPLSGRGKRRLVISSIARKVLGETAAISSPA